MVWVQRHLSHSKADAAHIKDGVLMMATTMRSARLHGKGEIKIDEIELPRPKENQLVVDVEWCGICGSDLHAYIDPGAMGATGGPMSLGHEIAGRISRPPEGSKFKDGDAVFVDPRVLCGSCSGCQGGKGHICRTFGYVGGTTPFGGYSDKIIVDEDKLHLLPPEIPLEYAAVIEPLAIVWHAIKVSGVPIPDWTSKSVLVLGGGPIGFALLLCLKAIGVKNVLVSEPTETRRKQVADYATTIINPITDDVEQKCKDATNGQGADVVFDCAGVPVGLEAGMKAIAYEGLYVMVAVWEKPMTVPCLLFLMKHVTLKGTFIIGDGEVAEVIEMMASGSLKGYEKMVTARIGLEDVVGKGFEELINHKDDHIKIMVTPRPIAV